MKQVSWPTISYCANTSQPSQQQLLQTSDPFTLPHFSHSAKNYTTMPSYTTLTPSTLYNQTETEFRKHANKQASLLYIYTIQLARVSRITRNQISVLRNFNRTPSHTTRIRVYLGWNNTARRFPSSLPQIKRGWSLRR